MVTQADIIEFQINEARRKLAVIHAQSKGRITAAGKRAAAELNSLLAQASKGSGLSAQGIRNTYAQERASGRQENASLAADLARQGGNTDVMQAMAAQQDAALGAQGNRTGAYQSDLDTLMSGIVADRKAASDATTLATQQELDANLAEQNAALDAQKQLAMLQLAAQGGGGGGGGGFGRRGGGGGGGSSGEVKPLTAAEMRQLNEAYASSQMKAPDIDKLAAQYVYGPLDQVLHADPALAAVAGSDVGRGLAPGQQKDVAREVNAVKIRADEQRNMNDVMRRIAHGDKIEDIIRGWNITVGRDHPAFNVGDVDTFLENYQRQKGAYDEWAAKNPTRAEFMQARIAEYYANQGVPVTDEEIHPTEHRLWKTAADKFLADRAIKEKQARATQKQKAITARDAPLTKVLGDWRGGDFGIADPLKLLRSPRGAGGFERDVRGALEQEGLRRLMASPTRVNTSVLSFGGVPGINNFTNRPTPRIAMPAMAPAVFRAPAPANDDAARWYAAASSRPDISHAAPPANFADILNWYAALDRGTPGAAGARRGYRMGGGRSYV